MLFWRAPHVGHFSRLNLNYYIFFHAVLHFLRVVYVPYILRYVLYYSILLVFHASTSKNIDLEVFS